MKVNHTLKPIYNNNSKILILGSIPSIKSRELNFYYANPTNRFWKIFEILFIAKLTTNEEKITFLHKNAIFITGKKAYETFIKNNLLNIKVFYLPSPSSANAKLSLNDLVNHYKIILEFL